MKKIILSGLIASIAMSVLGFFLSYGLGFIFPSVMQEYYNTAIFRPWSDPIMSLFFISPFALGFVLAFIWNKIKSIFNDTPLKNGLVFGFYYWLLGISGMIISYSSFKISLLMVITWTISMLVQSLVAGLIYSYMNK
jgi:hypothetical protein